MTLRLSLLIDANAKAAKSELDATAASAGKLTAGVDQLGKQSQQTRTQMGGLQDQTQRTTQATTMSAGAVGNLTAQFNDIGVMLMAGQNPLQLAIQQGTQITQVIGPMGAAGAARALGTAFMGLLSPMNLVTLGAIAATGYVVQWLTSGSDEAKSFEDAVGSLSDSVDAYVTASAEARSSTDELTKKFATQRTEIRALLRDMAELERREAERALAAATKSASSDVMKNRWLTLDFSDQATTAKFFDLDTQVAGTWKRVNDLIDAFQRLESAPTLDSKIAAAEELRVAFRQAAEASGEITKEEDAVLRQILNMVEEMRALKDEQVRAAYASSGLSDAMKGIQWALSSASETNLASVFTDADGPAAALLFKVQGIASGLAAIAREQRNAAGDVVGSGADSAPPIGLRPGGAFAPEVGRFGNPYAGEGGAGPMQSPRPKGNSIESYDRFVAAQEAAAKAAERAARAGSRGADRAHRESLQEATRLYEETRSSAQKYADETARVNKLHQLFPEIVTKDVKARALDKLKEDYTDLGRLGQDAAGAIRNAFDGIFDDPARALKNLAGELAQLVLYRQLGAWFPSMFGAQGAVPLVARAEGGPIYGPGTSTSDSILMWASNGEYMVNAASTALYRPLLEAINADKSGGLLRQLPRRAAGGIVNSDAFAVPMMMTRGRGAAGAGSAAPAVSVKVENYTGQPVQEERTTGPDGEEMIAIVVGKQIARGKYDRSNRSRYGNRPDPVKR
ncbi:Prophage tail length tape measure protein [[Luteovulum] sphaeroides subsp. megalophilum]|uniref:phage tail length tape measure family protein n=1 Tax=Cereibacter sphaeroides TaxID=1063 RepID=UPI000B6BABAA|nr:phage tail length tape measure family protein [Cereibacter sphaeroides]SNS86622.1 Prophage tail length tape measure protein [[Luteovulum] sphaeroides subsp. megalophilum]